MLGILAILAFFAVVFAGVLRLGRALRAAADPRSAARQVVCVGCAAPASSLTSFTCPSCGRDVRELGLARRAGPAAAGGASADPLGPLWRVVLLTVLVAILGGITTGALRGSLATRYDDVEFSRQSTFLNDNVDLRVTAQGARTVRRGADSVGSLAADLWVGGAGFASLELETPPTRGRVVDVGGAVLVPDAPLDLDLVLRWHEAAGADPNSPEVEHHARDELAALTGELRLPAIDLPPPKTPRPPLTSSSRGGGSGGSSGEAPPEWFAPAALTFWALLWLAGVWRRTGSGPPRTQPMPGGGDSVAGDAVPAGEGRA